MRELADSLGIETFVVAGGGLGVAYALACACKMPTRLTATVVGEMVAPGLRGNIPPFLVWLPAYAPWLVAQLLKLRVRSLANSPDNLWRRRLEKAQPGTRAFYQQPGMQKFWQDMQREAYRRGTDGVAHDFMLVARPWGFALSELKAPVYMWQAENDKAAVEAARFVAGQLPACLATFVPGADRLWMLSHADEIFATVNDHRWRAIAVKRMRD